MDSDWVHEIALRNLSLQDHASAIACAERERWLKDSQTRKDWIYLTCTGEVVAKLPSRNLLTHWRSLPELLRKTLYESSGEAVLAFRR
jgi:hypothetical protein